MFFIGGVSSKHEKLDFNQNIICPVCGRYGGLEFYVEYMYLSLFFIPVFKWNKKYFAKSTCCNAVYSISDELGARIDRGETVSLNEADLQLISGGEYGVQKCPHCGYELKEEYRFCPNCGRPL